MPEGTNQDIWKLDKDHVLHPWQHFDSFREEGALAIARGDGVWLYDTDGKKYLDAVGGLWCNNIGLGRTEMANAIQEQATRLAYSNPFVDMTSPPAALLAAKLAELAPADLDHVIFSTGGSTAVDTAWRLVQFYQRSRGKPEKRHVISRRESYHGSTYLAMSIGGKKGDRVPEFEYKEDTIHHVSAPDFYRAPDGMDEAAFVDFLVDELEQTITELGPENVAAFFAEPVMGAGGVIVPPEGYLKRVRALCTDNDILYVSDEVVTAFGRLGHWFASEDVFGITPDIITCAKGMTSGYLPLGATIFSSRIFDVINAPNPDRVFAHGFTYSGHPVCCAAALKNIEIITREGLLEKVQRDGPYFMDRLKTLEDLDIVGQVRGMGFMACIENVADKRTRALFENVDDVGKRIARACEERGLIVRPIGHLNVLSPPLILTRAEIDRIVETLGAAIAEVTDQLKAEGQL